jgi:uncharacterized membrane protein
VAYFSDASPESIGSLVQRVLTTEAGHRMILIGNFVGFLFAAAAFAMSVLSFPLLMDRNISAMAAASISITSVLRNPLTMAMWGLIVAGVLLIASPLPQGGGAGTAVARAAVTRAQGPGIWVRSIALSRTNGGL